MSPKGSRSWVHAQHRQLRGRRAQTLPNFPDAPLCRVRARRVYREDLVALSCLRGQSVQVFLFIICVGRRGEVRNFVLPETLVAVLPTRILSSLFRVPESHRLYPLVSSGQEPDSSWDQTGMIISS